MFVNNFFNIYLRFSPKDYVEPKPYIIYMYIYVTERSENIQGRVDSGQDDTGPTWLRGRLNFRPSWPATPPTNSGRWRIR